MTIFSPLKKHEYMVSVFGIGGTQCTLEMWNLLSLSSRCLFGFENGQSVSKLAAEFDANLYKAAEGTLFQVVGGKKVHSYMKMDSPWYFHDALRDNKHKHLKLDVFYNGGLWGLVTARCMTWDKKDARYNIDYVRAYDINYRR